MKKTIYLLCSLAFLNVAAFGQGVTVYQGATASNSKANITQTGGQTAYSSQEGELNQITVNQSQYLHSDNENGLALVQLSGSGNQANLTQSGEYTYTYITQSGNANQVTSDQSGTYNTLTLGQNSVGNTGNVANISQSGNYNFIEASQDQGSVTYGNQLNITQSGNYGKIYASQAGLAGGNNAFLNQSSDYSDLRVFEVGSYNSAHVTQSGGEYNQAYLRLDNSASGTTLGNNAFVTQTGSSNVFKLEVVGDNNIINAEQIGNNNIITDAYNSYGLGSLQGNGNTINAIQHGNNLTGHINLGGIHNTVVNVTSIPRS